MKPAARKPSKLNPNFHVFSESRTDVDDFKRWPANSRKFANEMLKKVQAAHPERDNGITDNRPKKSR